jgi:N-methylhydantoinase A
MSNSTQRLRIAVDIGGTFTDLAVFNETASDLSFGKALAATPFCR